MRKCDRNAMEKYYWVYMYRMKQSSMTGSYLGYKERGALTILGSGTNRAGKGDENSVAKMIDYLSMMIKRIHSRALKNYRGIHPTTLRRGSASCLTDLVSVWLLGEDK